MKKQTKVLLGILAVTLVFGMAVVGCVTTPFTDGVYFETNPGPSNFTVYDSSDKIVEKGVTNKDSINLKGKPPFKIVFYIAGYETETVVIKKENGKWVYGRYDTWNRRYYPEGTSIFDGTVKLNMEKSAETLAKEEATRREVAAEEANRYDPSKFTIVPSDFKPANYTKVDLFTAVANAERLPRINLPHLHTMADIYVRSEGGRLYTSDVVFVSQNGTDIVFKTDDNAISQSMKIADRSGLKHGQKVRLYYSVMKNPIIGFRVTAIEKL